MGVTLITVPSYVEAVRKSSLKERSEYHYRNVMKSKLHKIEGNKVLFREYLNEAEYWEYAFERKGVKKIDFIYTTYGIE